MSMLYINAFDLHFYNWTYILYIRTQGIYMTNNTALTTAERVAPLGPVIDHADNLIIDVAIVRYGKDGDPDEPEFDVLQVPVPADVLCWIGDILRLRDYLRAQVATFCPLWAYHGMELSCLISCEIGDEPF